MENLQPTGRVLEGNKGRKGGVLGWVIVRARQEVPQLSLARTLPLPEGRLVQSVDSLAHPAEIC